MAGEMHNSALLDRIMEAAEILCLENECGMSRDYLVLASLSVLEVAAGAGNAEEPELAELRKLLEPYAGDSERRARVLQNWHGKAASLAERMILSTGRGKALNRAKREGRTELTAVIYLEEILRDGTPGFPAPQSGKERPEDRISSRVSERAEEHPEERQKPAEAKTDGAAEAAKEPESIGEMVRRSKKLQQVLQETVLGQQHAVSVFAAGYFQAELQAGIEKDRKRPRATFLFAGPPGVGKTFLAEEAARVLGLPARRYDMSEYTGPNATDELAGSDANYRGSSEGLLTGFVSKNPHCVLLFDEIEKASLEVIHLFLQILDAGRLRDNRTDREVSFRDTILIFTTNAGKALYTDGDSANLSYLSRDVILDALAREINPRTQEPFFPAAICSRFASGNVIMFNHLEAHSLRTIIDRQMSRHAGELQEAMRIRVNIGENVPTALLLAEGAAADARTVRSRADSFFSGELYELFRMISSDAVPAEMEKIREINMDVYLDEAPEEVCRLFTPVDRVHALAFTGEKFPEGMTDGRIPVLHYVENAEEAGKTIQKESIELVFCDLFSGEAPAHGEYLNLEDRASPARDFLKEMLLRYPSVPVVILEKQGHYLTEEEKISYLRQGVRGFLSMDPEGLEERLSSFAGEIFQQNSLVRLARSNRLVRYETAQRVNEAGDGADILMFDFKLEKAIKSGDADNVLSMLSTPDVHFDDVIGADDAKDELRFFVNYMQNPKRYRGTGISAPKGVLLYGPPGTGKTMLAKAFAAESRATFIATEGNQFFKGIVGQGAAMVHRLFATARRYAPSVIFIDEIDAVARARSGRDTDLAQDSEQILTALFAEMDGFETTGDKPVFVLGATNYGVDPGARMTIDPAMLRRFDRRILVDMPNLENRKKFLAKEMGKKTIFRVSEEGMASLADRSTGMSLAQLSSVLDLSIRTAMKKQAEYVDDATLEEAFGIFNSGEAKKWDVETTLRTARHEAGHALVSWLSGEKPSFVTIVSRGDYGGYMQHADQEEKMGYTRQELLNLIRTALGGRAAEIVFYGKEDGLSTGASGDLRKATALAEQILCRYGMDEQFGLAVIDPNSKPLSDAVQARVNELLREQLDQAIREISREKEKMDRLVENLLKKNSLKGEDIDRILQNQVK